MEIHFQLNIETSVNQCTLLSASLSVFDIQTKITWLITGLVQLN